MKKYTVDEIFSILQKTKNTPFCFGDAEREAVLTDPMMKAQLDSLREYAEDLRADGIVPLTFSTFRRFETDGDRSEYESAYFHHRQRLAAFTILYWLYGKEEDKVALEDTIWSILDEYTWSVPAHLQRKGLSVLQEDGYMIDLFAAETGEALAEMLTLVGDQLSPIVKQRTERYLNDRILKYATDPFGWNQGCTNNWCAVCSGSVAMCAIYMEKDTERLAEILAKYIDVIQKNFYRGFAADGACLEGLAYWTYGVGYFTYFADLLKKRTAGEIDLFLDEPVKNIALFFGKCFFPGKGSVTFADAGAKCSYQPALTAYYASLYPGEFVVPPMEYINMRYPQDHCARFALLLRNFVWASGRIVPQDTQTFATHLLPSAEWYLSTAKNGTAIAAKGGCNNEPHNHNDVGSFHLFKNGKMLLMDIGCPAYDAFYFSAQRYTYFAACSRSHSVPVINGTYQSPGAERRAKDVVLTERGIRMDISSAYDLPSLTSLVRDLRFDNETGVLTLSDSYAFTEAPESIRERFPLPCAPVLTDGVAIVENQGERMEIHFDPIVFRPEISSETDYKHFNLAKVGVATSSDASNRRTTYLLDLIVKHPSESTTVTVIIK